MVVFAYSFFLSSFLVGEYVLGPPRLPANGSGGNGHFPEARRVIHLVLHDTSQDIPQADRGGVQRAAQEE
jgi:hypothetical protein